MSAAVVLAALTLGGVAGKPTVLELAPAWDSPRYLQVPILDQSFEVTNDGAYRWGFSGGDGTEQWAEAAPAWSGGLGGALRGVRGGYGYSGAEGPVAVSYVADEYGFQPAGSAIHPEIMRAVALQVAKAKEEPEDMWDERGFPLLRAFFDYD